MYPNTQTHVHTQFQCRLKEPKHRNVPKHTHTLIHTTHNSTIARRNPNTQMYGSTQTHNSLEGTQIYSNTQTRVDTHNTHTLFDCRLKEPKRKCTVAHESTVALLTTRVRACVPHAVTDVKSTKNYIFSIIFLPCACVCVRAHVWEWLASAFRCFWLSVKIKLAHNIWMTVSVHPVDCLQEAW